MRLDPADRLRAGYAAGHHRAGSCNSPCWFKSLSPSPPTCVWICLISGFISTCNRWTVMVRNSRSGAPTTA